VTPGPRRPWLFAALGFAIIVGWLAIGTALAPLFSSGWLVAAWTLIAIVPLVLVSRRLAGPAALKVVEFGVFPLLLAGICASVAVPELVLAARGETVTAVITTAERHTTGKGSVYFDYTLRAVGGGDVPGRLEISDDRPVGTRVEVVVDPDGVATPDLAGSVAAKAAWLTALAAAGTVLLAVVMGWAAARSPGGGSPRSGRRGSRPRR
jgi:hypothetical protein